MIHLHDINKKKIAGLTEYKNLYIESELQSGDKTLCFSYPKKAKYHSDIVEECYIKTKENEYIVKEKNVESEYTSFKCILNLEDLEGKPFERYASEEQTIDKALALALAGTGWIVGKCSLKKRRTVRISNCSSLEVIKEIKKTYRCDLVFNTLTRTIDVYERLGEYKGTYFIDSLNLKDLSIQGNSYDFFTRLIPVGKDNLRISPINNGKDYVENYQYSSKVKTFYWIDERYTIAENLKEDAEAKLNELSKPYRSYSADIINLAKLNNKYKDILDFKLGDTVYLISKDNKFRDKQRIVKFTEYPDEHELDTVELANTTLSFEETQTQFQETTDTVTNITTDNGTINGSTIDEINSSQIKDFDSEVIRASKIEALDIKVHTLEAHNVTITGELNAVKANIGTLTTNVANIDSLTVLHSASINELQANKASITQVEAVNATIQVLEANVGKIETLVNGNLSSENIQAGGITSDKLTIENGFITNAMIHSLDVSKVNAGDISTNKFRIKSDDGGVEIVGATQQFKDKNNKVRIQMGKDVQGNFNFIIKGEDGTTTLIDHTGIKANAIADDLIANNMIASDAVGEKQINYSSFANGFNKDTNTNTLKATKIKLDNQNQTLELAFKNLKTQADDTKSLTEFNSTTINIMQGQINMAIDNTQITKDGKIILLKDDYNHTVATVDSINNTLGSHTTQINQHTGQITGVEVKTNELERNLNSFSSRLNSTENTLINHSDSITNTNNKVSVIDQNLSSITNRVSSVETTTANIDGKISNLSTRMNSVEHKLTDSSIISIVNSQFYNKGQTDSLFTTRSIFEQTINEFNFKIYDNTNVNIMTNSSFEKEEEYTRNHPFVLDWTRGGVDGYPPTIDGGKAIRIFTNGGDSYFVKNTAIKIKPNTTYVISYYYACSHGRDGSNYIFINGNPLRIPITYTGDRSWHRHEYVFTTPSNIDGITQIRFGIIAQETCWLLIDLVQIEEDNGNRKASKYRPNALEVCSGVSFIDKEGMGVKHDDGSYTKMLGNGFRRYIKSANYEYHYLTYIGKTQKLNMNPVTVQLPDDFKGKDFKVTLSIEEIANPPGWFIQSFQVLVGAMDRVNARFEILGGSQSQYHDGTQGTMKPTTVAYTVTA